MNSIDDKAMRALTDPLFDAFVTPDVAKPQPFPMGPAPGLPSYFVPRPTPSMKASDFLAPSCLEAEEFARQMEAHWRAQGQPELAARAAHLAAAATALHALYLVAQPEADVSPYVYQMF